MLENMQISTAEDLRREMAALDGARKRRSTDNSDEADRALRDFITHFLKDHLGKRDFSLLRRQILDAARRGEFEVMVMRFPSTLCSDGGRAVNNGLQGWEETLPGKAHEAHRVWRAVGRERGFRLIARVLDFPGGMPGDVGLFVNWAAPMRA